MLKFQNDYLGLYIKKIMKKNDLSQKEFGSKCGIKQGNLSRIMSGKVVCSLDSLVKISDVYKLDLEYLLMLRIKTEFDNLYGTGSYDVMVDDK